MDVITIESQAYAELLSKINAIARFVVEHQRAAAPDPNPDEEWVDSYEVCTFLSISERTLQRLRTKGVISYSLIAGKTYYTIAEIKRVLTERRVRTSGEALQNLIDNHRRHAEQRRDSKAHR